MPGKTRGRLSAPVGLGVGGPGRADCTSAGDDGPYATINPLTLSRVAAQFARVSGGLARQCWRLCLVRLVCSQRAQMMRQACALRLTILHLDLNRADKIWGHVWEHHASSSSHSVATRAANSARLFHEIVEPEAFSSTKMSRICQRFDYSVDQSSALGWLHFGEARRCFPETYDGRWRAT